MPRRLFIAIFALSLAIVACVAIPGDQNTPAASTATEMPQAGESTPAAELEPTLVPTEVPTEIPTELPPPVANPATSFPDAQNYRWVEVASGMNLPVDITNAGDGSGRLFV